MKTYLLAVSGAVLIGMSLAACSTGPTGTPSAVLTNAAVAPVNKRTYTADDIATILTSVNTRLNLAGTVETQDGPQTGAVDALSAMLTGDDLAVTPASCVDLLKSDTQLVSKLGSVGVVAGTLSSSQLNLIVTTVNGAALPASLNANFVASQHSILTSCEHVTITETVDGQPTSVTADYTTLAVKTSANQSVGFRESFDIMQGGSGGSSSRTTLEAIDGNLLIFASGALAQDEATLERAVNAVVAAAKE